MADIVPKIADIKNLQDLGKIFALPMLAVAYILQTGLSIGWDSSVWLSISPELSEQVQINRYVLIVIGKTIWISFFGMFVYGFIAWVHIYSNETILPTVAIILFSFALLGVFAPDNFSVTHKLNSFWFYACFVWGFFLLSMKEQIDS